MATVPDNPVRQYFDDVWRGIRTTAIGMSITWREMFRRETTLVYPREMPKIPHGHRGLHGYDEPKCISCDMCAKACPVECIYIQSVGRGKDALMTQFDIDYTKCLFCDLCTPPCPEDCIWMTTEYDLASYYRGDCIVNFARTKTEEEIAEHKGKLEKKDAERKAKMAAKKAEAEAQAEAQAPGVAPAATPPPAPPTTDPAKESN